MAGLSSLGVKLKKGSTEIPNLRSFPDLGSAPERIDVTVLTDSIRKYINGVQDAGEMAFTFLFDPEQTNSAWDTLNTDSASTSAISYTLEIPSAGSFAFSAIPSVYLNGAEANAALEFTASFALQSAITFTAATL